jgi:hypothetical protein
MRLYLDEHVPVVLASFLVAHGADCLTTRDAGNLSLSDEDQLIAAARDHRTLVTFDSVDFCVWPKSGAWLAARIRASFFQKYCRSRNSFGVSVPCWFIVMNVISRMPFCGWRLHRKTEPCPLLQRGGIETCTQLSAIS